MSDLYSLTPTRIVMYATLSCADCARARLFLDSNHIPYLEVLLEEDERAVTFVESLNRGYRSVPTLIFPDGSMLVEPSQQQLAARFSIRE